MPGPPMQYIRCYTEEAVKRGAAPRPPPPIPDTYSMFGLTINNDDAIIQTLESQARRTVPIPVREKVFFGSGSAYMFFTA